MDFFYHVVTLKYLFWENALQSLVFNLTYLEEAIPTKQRQFIFYLVELIYFLIKFSMKPINLINIDI